MTHSAPGLMSPAIADMPPHGWLPLARVKCHEYLGYYFNLENYFNVLGGMTDMPWLLLAGSSDQVQ